jgi:opacity protein-like surface antigen
VKSVVRMFSIVASGVLAGAFMLPSPAKAQNRANSLEFILPVIYSSSTSFTGDGGSSADLNSDLGFGFGIGYNLNNYLQLSGLVNWSTRSYNATLVDDNSPAAPTTRKASGTMEASTLSFNATWYFIPSGFTPFVSAGIGSTFVDTNIPNGGGGTACWWDPWYGYICDTYQNTKTYTSVSYTAGAGVRFAVSRAFSLQGSYNKLWIDGSNAKPEIDGWRLDLVFRM